MHSFAGGWTRIDCPQVPRHFYEHLIKRIGCKINAVRDRPHKRQPRYFSSTRCISYKIYDLNQFWDAVQEQQLVELKEEVLFSGNTHLVEKGTQYMTVEEELQLAKERAYRPRGQRGQASSKSSLVVGYGEGRCTREVELIWWPSFYSITDFGKLIFRMFISKTEF